ncbi:MAG: nucleotidyltransferase domain-containing protein [Nitrososphaerota archaeon]
MLERLSESEELAKTVNILISNLKVYAIILTGSRARGNYKPWSDYDILIIAEFREKHLDRITKILELLKDIELNIEPHPYTIEEATEMLKKKPTNNRHTIRRKNPIHHKKKFEEIIKLYKNLINKGLTKTKTTIILPTNNTTPENNTNNL